MKCPECESRNLVGPTWDKSRLEHIVRCKGCGYIKHNADAKLLAQHFDEDSKDHGEPI